jgi:hypothetical protein
LALIGVLEVDEVLGTADWTPLAADEPVAELPAACGLEVSAEAEGWPLAVWVAGVRVGNVVGAIGKGVRLEALTPGASCVEGTGRLAAAVWPLVLG